MLLRVVVVVFVFILTAHANTGEATFFTPGLGACGVENTTNDFIVAVSAEFFDSFPGATTNPNSNPICNPRLTAHSGNASVIVTVTDRCAGCEGQFDLDLSPVAFEQLADPSIGRLFNVEWSLDSAGFTQRRSTSANPVHVVSTRASTPGTAVEHRMLRRRREA
ncbi:hypothetical protein E4T56_gene1400 [Termitomyces sp. T112]|nr:hypothetical protein E4T56_gene1400 [Termitomyces sp. T112]